MNIYIKKENKNTNRLVIDNITDLLKLSPEELKKAQYSDFSGKYFQQINDEVIKMEKKPKLSINNLNEPINRNKNKIYSQINKNINEEIINDFNDENDDYRINDINDNNNDKNEYLNNDEKYIPEYKSLNSSISQKNKIGILRNNSPIIEYNNFNNNIYPIKKIIFTIYYNTIFGQEIAISGSNNKLGNWDKNSLLYLNWSKGNKWIGEIDINEDELEDFEFKFVLCQNNNIISWEPGENNNVYFNELINKIKENLKGIYNKYQYEYNKNNSELTLNCKWYN